MTGRGEDAGMTVDAWLDARVPTRVVHLDAAGAGRPSREVLDAEVAHLHREAASSGVTPTSRDDIPSAQVRSATSRRYRARAR